MYVNIYEPAHEISVNVALPSNKGSGETVQMHRLAKAFAASIHKLKTQT